jgi:osmotically-inducible protein OsmY
MTRRLRFRIWLVSAVLALCACSADTATQERPRDPADRQQTDSTGDPSALSVPGNSIDREIRRELSVLLDRDPALKDREINFIVSKGDVSVTGTVRTEEERRKINELALAIPEVRSVANALRVSP